MTGKELFKSYIQKRDDYARVLMAGFGTIGEEIYTLLEKAEAEGKKIVLTYPLEDTFAEPYPTIN